MAYEVARYRDLRESKCTVQTFATAAGVLALIDDVLCSGEVACITLVTGSERRPIFKNELISRATRGD